MIKLLERICFKPTCNVARAERGNSAYLFHRSRQIPVAVFSNALLMRINHHHNHRAKQSEGHWMCSSGTGCTSAEHSAQLQLLHPQHLFLHSITLSFHAILHTSRSLQVSWGRLFGRLGSQSFLLTTFLLSS